MVIADNWRNRPEDTSEYVILGLNFDRVFISPVRWQKMGLSIKPVSLVTKDNFIDANFVSNLNIEDHMQAYHF